MDLYELLRYERFNYTKVMVTEEKTTICVITYLQRIQVLIVVNFTYNIREHAGCAKF